MAGRPWDPKPYVSPPPVAQGPAVERTPLGSRWLAVIGPAIVPRRSLGVLPRLSAAGGRAVLAQGPVVARPNPAVTWQTPHGLSVDHFCCHGGKRHSYRIIGVQILKFFSPGLLQCFVEFFWKTFLLKITMHFN